MTTFATTDGLASTSAGGGMLGRYVALPMLIGPMLLGPGTSSGPEVPSEPASLARAAGRTSAGLSVPAQDPAGASIAELRRLSGLSWDQLAGLFGVSRRALHFWASGKAMAPSNEEHLQRLLGAVRKIDRGSASANRTALLSEQGSKLPLDLLAEGKYDRVVSLLGSGEARRVQAPRLSPAAAAARAPRPPAELVGALHNRVHPSSGGLLAARAVRIDRSK